MQSNFPASSGLDLHAVMVAEAHADDQAETPPDVILLSILCFGVFVTLIVYFALLVGTVLGAFFDGFLVMGDLLTGIEYARSALSTDTAGDLPEFEYTVGPCLALAAGGHRVHRLAPKRPMLHAVLSVALTIVSLAVFAWVWA